MSYTPTTWADNDLITAARLNNMESGIEDAQNGWSVETTSSTYYSGSITTESSGNYCVGSEDGPAEGISADTAVTVTFNGTDYALTVDSDGKCGAPYNNESDTYDFTTCPFGLYIYYMPFLSSYVIELYTESEGTYTVVVSVQSTTVTTSEDFDTAAQMAVEEMVPFRIVLDTTTFQEAYNAMSAGRLAYTYSLNDRLCVAVYASTSSFKINCITIYSTSTITSIELTASSADDVLTM